MFRRQQSRATISLAPPVVARWNELIGVDGFSATCWLVHTMGLARRWPELAGEVFLGSLRFSFGQAAPMISKIALELYLRQNHRHWLMYSFNAGEAGKEFFSGSATIFTGVENSKLSHSSPEPTPGKLLLSLRLTSEAIDRYLEFSGDHNPIHRQGAGTAVCPGLLLLGYAEAGLKNAGIPLANSAAVQVRYRSPAFVGESLDLQLVPENTPWLQMSVDDRVIATVSLG